MLRGLIAPMEKHHKVRVSDAAVVCAVQFSHRYIPARQLPTRPVSLLDTACARVAISQNAKPAAIEDAQVHIAALEQEREALMRERDLGAADEERIAEIDEALVPSAPSSRRSRANGPASASWSRRSRPCAPSLPARRKAATRRTAARSRQPRNGAERGTGRAAEDAEAARTDFARQGQRT